jgi:hypothetical protein
VVVLLNRHGMGFGGVLLPQDVRICGEVRRW